MAKQNIWSANQSLYVPSEMVTKKILLIIIIIIKKNWKKKKFQDTSRNRMFKYKFQHLKHIILLLKDFK